MFVSSPGDVIELLRAWTEGEVQARSVEQRDGGARVWRRRRPEP
jgi:hypothetical protein